MGELSPYPQPTFLQVFPSHCSLDPQPTQTGTSLFPSMYWALGWGYSFMGLPHSSIQTGGGFLYPHSTDEETE